MGKGPLKGPSKGWTPQDEGKTSAGNFRLPNSINSPLWTNNLVQLKLKTFPKCKTLIFCLPPDNLGRFRRQRDNNHPPVVINTQCKRGRFEWRVAFFKPPPSSIVRRSPKIGLYVLEILPLERIGLPTEILWPYGKSG